jgi:hypothetical protein
VIRYTPTGGIDTDSDDLYIGAGNYRYALNLRNNTLSKKGTLTTLKGTSLVANLPGVTQQYHSIRFHIDLNQSYSGDGAVFTAAIYNFKGIITEGTTSYGTGVAAYPTLSGIDPVTDMFEFISENLKSLNPLAQLNDPLLLAFNLIKTSSYSGYFDITATALGAKYFKLFITTTEGTISTSGDWGSIRVEVLQEGIDVEGALVPIGSFNNNGDVYIVSTLADGGILEIGALRHTLTNKENNAWSYTKLLRTVEVNLNPNYPVSCDGERDELKDSLYITDNNISPIKFYLPKDNFVTNGGLVSNGGYLTYGNIYEQMKLFSNSGSAYIDEIQVGTSGRLSAGSKRYTGRFMTTLLASTDFLPLSNPVPIFSAKLNDPLNLVGDIPGDITDKSVSMTVNNIPQNVYKYFELAVVEYSGDSFTQKIVHRYAIAQNTTSINIAHTDVGQDNVDLSIEEISALKVAYSKAKSIALIDNQLTLSNLSDESTIDLSEWAQTFKHYIDVHSLESCGDFGYVGVSKTINDAPNIKLGEYQVPSNVTNYTGYMYNDTYRFGVEVKWKSTGKWSSPFWVDDIRIDDSVTNVIGGRRSKACAVGNGQLYNNGSVYVYHPVFHGIDFNYSVQEGRVLDLIDEIRFMRSARIPEVLATGLGLVGIYNGATDIILSAGGLPIFSDYIFFYSPDHILGGTPPYLDINNVSIKLTLINPGINYVKPVTFVNNVIESGYLVQLGQPTNSPSGTRQVLGATYVGGHGTKSLLGYNVSGGFAKGGGGTDAMVMKLSSGFNPTLEDTDINQIGAYVQQFLDLGGNIKYPSNKELSQYFSISNPYWVGNQSEYSIFSGDVYTQRTVLRITSNDMGSIRRGLGYSFYSQNTVNSQLRSINEEGAGYVFPQKLNKDFTTTTYPVIFTDLQKSMSNWLGDTFSSEQQFYYKHYNAKESILLDSGFNAEDIIPKSYPSRVAWSMYKPNASVSDFNTIFQPLDYKDLDLNSGEITHHSKSSGYLYFWQPREFRRESFNFMTLVSSTAGDIVAGSGNEMSQRGITISRYGCSHKWSVVKAYSRGGDDVFYWFDDNTRKIIRFGSDGVNPISDQRALRSFLNEGYFDSSDNPVNNIGINAVYDPKHSEVLFTFKLRDEDRYRDIDLLATTAVTGNIYNWISGLATPGIGLSGLEMVEGQMYYSANSLDKSGTFNIFRYKGGIGDTQYAEPAEGSSYYTLLPISTASLNNVFTAVWDENKSEFRGFFDFYPNLYIPLLDGYITTNPKIRNKLYLHDASTTDLSFYDYLSNYKFKFLFNYDPNLAKIFVGIQYNVDRLPDLVEYRTDTGSGFFDGSTITKLDDLHYSPIPTNSRVVGKFLEVTITGKKGQSQKIINFITKYRPSYIIYQ